MLVVKIGGSLESNTQRIVDDIVAHRSATKEGLVVVHGGSRGIDELGRRLGLPGKALVSVNGLESRYTDEATLSVLIMALAGTLNTTIVDMLVRQDVPAVGLSGVDGAVVLAERKRVVRAKVDGKQLIVRDNYTGRIRSVNVGLLRLLLEGKYVPVISPPALDPDDGPVNVDADRLAAAIAGAICASRLLLLTDQPGLLADRTNPSSVVERITSEDLPTYHALAFGRMKVKMLAAEAAMRSGVGLVIIAGGTNQRPITAALAGGGTHLENSSLPRCGDRQQW